MRIGIYIQDLIREIGVMRKTKRIAGSGRTVDDLLIWNIDYRKTASLGNDLDAQPMTPPQRRQSGTDKFGKGLDAACSLEWLRSKSLNVGQ